MWSILGHQESLAYASWPTFDPALLVDDHVEVPVQISGKIKSRITVPADADAAFLESAAKADPKIAELLEGKTIIKSILVPGKLVNFVVK